MRKLIILFVIVILCFSVLTPAYADVLWSPIDAYWWINHEKCTYLGHYYIINGPEGYVPVYADPTQTEPYLYLPNGGEFFIAAYVEIDGRKMGVIQYKTTETGEIVHNWYDNVEAYFRNEDDYSITWEKGSGTGWLDMSLVVKKYDYSSFEEEFGDQFEKGEFKYEPVFEKDTTVYLWAYPGAETPQGTLTIRAEESSGDNPTFSSLFTDENGLEWGYIKYHYGHRDIWICISDPSNDSLPVREIGYDLIPAAEQFPGAASVSSSVWSSPYFAIALVALVVVITAVLIAVLYRKKPSAGADDK